MLRDMLKPEGFGVGRKHVRTVMDKMGIAAIYRQRNTSAPHPVHWIYHGCVAGRKFRASLGRQPGYSWAKRGNPTHWVGAMSRACSPARRKCCGASSAIVSQRAVAQCANDH